MARREGEKPPSGRVGMDDAHPGGVRSGGRRGRGAPGRTPFTAAVSTTPEGRPRKARPVPVRGFRKRGTALGDAGRNHRAIRTGSGRGAARMAPFKRINTSLGNIKSAITGTYRKPGPDHAERHPAGFARRCNRRHHPRTMIPGLPHSAARARPTPYHALIAG